MSDAIPAPSCSQVEKLLAQGALSAHEISALLRCSIRQTMESLHCCWWTVVPIAGDYPGFRYQLRHVLSQRLAKPTESAKHYANSRIAYPSTYT